MQLVQLSNKLRPLTLAAGLLTGKLHSNPEMLKDKFISQTRKDIQVLNALLNIENKEDSWKSKIIVGLLLIANVISFFFLIFAICNSTACLK